jgi:hypothetical protein
MAGILSTIVAAIDREYDRRIRRASLITEYGATHHGHPEEAHGAADASEDDGDVAIANVPRGADVAAVHAEDESTPPSAGASGAAPADLELDPLPLAEAPRSQPTAAPADDGEVEIVNTRPGTPVNPGQ